MDTKALVDELARFGLSPRQAEAYIFLLGNGSSTASQTARGTGRNRSDTYRVLRELFEHGLVEKNLSSDRKTLFTPTSSREAVHRLLAAKKKEVDELSESVEEIINRLDLFKREPGERVERPEIFRMFFRIIGEAGVSDAVERMFRGAKQEIDLVISSRSLSLWFMRGVDEVLKGMSRQGVKVRIITKIDDGNLDDVERCSAFCQVRHTENTIYNTCIVDGKEVIMGTPTRDALEKDRYDAYLATSELGLVDTLKAFFERTWEASIDAQEKLHSLKRESQHSK